MTTVGAVLGSSRLHDSFTRLEQHLARLELRRSAKNSRSTESMPLSARSQSEDRPNGVPASTDRSEERQNQRASSFYPIESRIPVAVTKSPAKSSAAPRVPRRTLSVDNYKKEAQTNHELNSWERRKQYENQIRRARSEDAMRKSSQLVDVNYDDNEEEGVVKVDTPRPEHPDTSPEIIPSTPPSTRKSRRDFFQPRSFHKFQNTKFDMERLRMNIAQTRPASEQPAEQNITTRHQQQKRAISLGPTHSYPLPDMYQHRYDASFHTSNPFSYHKQSDQTHSQPSAHGRQAEMAAKDAFILKNPELALDLNLLNSSNSPPESAAMNMRDRLLPTSACSSANTTPRTRRRRSLPRVPQIDKNMEMRKRLVTPQALQQLRSELLANDQVKNGEKSKQDKSRADTNLIKQNQKSSHSLNSDDMGSTQTLVNDNGSTNTLVCDSAKNSMCDLSQCAVERTHSASGKTKRSVNHQPSQSNAISFHILPQSSSDSNKYILSAVEPGNDNNNQHSVNKNKVNKKLLEHSAPLLHVHKDEHGLEVQAILAQKEDNGHDTGYGSPDADVTRWSMEAQQTIKSHSTDSNQASNSSSLSQDQGVETDDSASIPQPAVVATSGSTVIQRLIQELKKASMSKKKSNSSAAAAATATIEKQVKTWAEDMQNKLQSKIRQTTHGKPEALGVDVHPSLHQVLACCDLLAFTLERGKSDAQAYGVKLYDCDYNDIYVGDKQVVFRSPAGRKSSIGSQGAFLPIAPSSEQDKTPKLVCIETILPESEASGHLMDGDFIMEVNGRYTVDKKAQHVVNLLELAAPSLKVVVARPRDHKFSGQSAFDLAKEVEKLTVKNETLKSEAEHNHDIIADLKMDLKDREDHLQALQKNAVFLESKISSAEADVKKKEENAKTWMEKWDKKAAEADVLRAQLKKRNAEVAQLQALLLQHAEVMNLPGLKLSKYKKSTVPNANQKESYSSNHKHQEKPASEQKPFDGTRCDQKDSPSYNVNGNQGNATGDKDKESKYYSRNTEYSKLMNIGNVTGCSTGDVNNTNVLPFSAYLSGNKLEKKETLDQLSRSDYSQTLMKDESDKLTNTIDNSRIINPGTDKKEYVIKTHAKIESKYRNGDSVSYSNVKRGTSKDTSSYRSSTLKPAFVPLPWTPDNKSRDQVQSEELYSPRVSQQNEVSNGSSNSGQGFQSNHLSPRAASISSKYDAVLSPKSLRKYLQNDRNGNACKGYSSEGDGGIGWKERADMKLHERHAAVTQPWTPQIRGSSSKDDTAASAPGGVFRKGDPIRLSLNKNFGSTIRSQSKFLQNLNLKTSCVDS